MSNAQQPKPNAALIGAGYMILAGLLFAISNIVVQKLTMGHGLASTTVAFWQYFIALLFSLPWVFTRLRSALATTQIGWHIFRVALSVAGVQLWILGLSTVPIWQAIALLMTSPFFVTIGARVFLGETVTFERWVTVAVGFIGGMIILAPWSDTFTVDALYPVGAAALWAGTSLVTKHLTVTEGADTLTLYLLILLTPVNAFLAAGSGFGINAEGAIWLIVGAGLVMAAAQFTLVKAYAVADAAYLQPFDHIKLPWNVLLGFLVFGYAPEGHMWLGTGLILAASLYLMRAESRAA